ncbi:ATP-binding cassette domain-containing protein [Kocuria koreensis]|uniref:ATP-binding cassette domain-containing protein n=1 Tax=Rothia koreensis TaxID=592378 RepID=A0A7K1LFU0_9MICC|nr:ATP-binding cassette domain-containing protein [Rothia koreensis]MUN54055.1 ATP-binding cassette domain-containing protein [Rothia koreensis]
MSEHRTPSVELEAAALSFGDRTLWKDLTLEIDQGEYFAVLGPNGSGKSTFLKTLLGLLPLSEGAVRVLGDGVRRGNPRIGYVPQQRAFGPDTPLRARDLVGLGLDGHRWGPGFPSRRRRARVDELLERVGATEYAAVPVGLLSGGEQQRLRVAQALASRPRLLLCDEALLSLDLRHQSAVSQLIEEYRRESGATVVFVTHEINPIIDDVDRVLYLANGRFTVGSVEDVMTTETLSRVYGAPVQVLRVDGRYVVVGSQAASEAPGNDCHAHDVGGEA